jgi:hypothetical protein
MLEEPLIVPRYVSRERHFGESPVASHTALRQLLRRDDENPLVLELSYDDDDSNWEDVNSKPFERPKRPRGVRREELHKLRKKTKDVLCSEARGALLDSESTRRELPPQIDFPVSETTIFGESSGQFPLLDNQRTREKPISCREIEALHPGRFKIDEDAIDIHTVEANAKLTWKGVTELLACDIGAHQIAYLMTDYADGRITSKGYSSNWIGQLPNDLYPLEKRENNPTVESRLAAGSLDAEWIVTWIKIQCRMLEWARDADPAQFMNVISKLSRDDHSQGCTYDVLDFLRDIGLYTELKLCQDRLRRVEEAWYQCMLLKSPPSDFEEDSSDPRNHTEELQRSPPHWSPPFVDSPEQALPSSATSERIASAMHNGSGHPVGETKQQQSRCELQQEEGEEDLYGSE